ncbi:MAG: hypothetical protein C0467_09155 [Planctomycetaceae bacterium]|nr:hypothetical protein [Planctomycetaceae bacterium]
MFTDTCVRAQTVAFLAVPESIPRGERAFAPADIPTIILSETIYGRIEVSKHPTQFQSGEDTSISEGVLRSAREWLSEQLDVTDNPIDTSILNFSDAACQRDLVVQSESILLGDGITRTGSNKILRERRVVVMSG